METRLIFVGPVLKCNLKLPRLNAIGTLLMLLAELVNFNKFNILSLFNIFVYNFCTWR